jgi:hypothetical protein
MTMSPGFSQRAISSTVLPAKAAGTITHAARGPVSFETNSSSERAPVAPSDSSWATASGWMS